MYLANCLDCHPVLAQPFTSAAERDTWASAHSVATHHKVLIYDDGQPSEEDKIRDAMTEATDNPGRMVTR